MENYTRNPMSEQWGQPSQPTYYYQQPPPQMMQQSPAWYPPPMPLQVQPEKKKGRGATIAALVCSICTIAFLILAIIVGAAGASGLGVFFLCTSICLDVTVTILLIIAVARGK